MILKYQFLGFAKDVLNSNSILLLVLHRQEILCFVEDDLTTRPDMSGLSWGMLWDIRWDLTVFRKIRVDSEREEHDVQEIII